MLIYNKEYFKVLLFSTLLVMVPMFYFPARFGMDLAMGSFTYSMFEIVFYGLVFYLFRPKVTLIQLFAGAGLTFLYRIMIGSVFGIFLSFMYHMNFSVSLALGVSRYLPAILLQVMAAPFVMRPFFLLIVDQTVVERRPARRERPITTAVQPRKDIEEVESIMPFHSRPESRPVRTGSDSISEGGPSGISLGSNMDGFDRAVKYLGEHHAVVLATVVDSEGLTLGTFKRGDIDPDIWAPYSLLFRKANSALLHRAGDQDNIENIDMIFGSRRLVIVKTVNFNLLVLSNHEEDELLNIRIKQAAEIVKKYASERYGRLLPANTGEQYVSHT
nr:hypothetical protein [candidate division Zixibacteria bacterium]